MLPIDGPEGSVLTSMADVLSGVFSFTSSDTETWECATFTAQWILVVAGEAMLVCVCKWLEVWQIT